MDNNFNNGNNGFGNNNAGNSGSGYDLNKGYDNNPNGNEFNQSNSGYGQNGSFNQNGGYSQDGSLNQNNGYNQYDSFNQNGSFVSQGSDNFNNGSYNNYGSQQPQQGSNGMAIASIVVGALSILSCCCWWLALILGIVGVVLAILSKNKSVTGKMETTAVVGMILCIVGIVIAIVTVIGSAAVVGTPEYQEFYNEIMNSY